MTEAQKLALDFIVAFIKEHDGVSPSFQEIGNHLGLASKSNVHRLVQALVDYGQIQYVPNRARSITVPHSLEAYLKAIISTYRQGALTAERAMDSVEWLLLPPSEK